MELDLRHSHMRRREGISISDLMMNDTYSNIVIISNEWFCW